MINHFLKIMFLWLQELRIHHWVKNLFVFAPLIFSGNLRNLHAIKQSTLLFILFSFLSSSVYISNDLIDIKNDRQHPKKKNRPIAKGLIPKASAVIVSLLLMVMSLGMAWKFSAIVFFVLLAYLANNFLYSLYLKNKVIADVLSISIGFMLRFLGGSFAINEEPSRWLLVCGFSLSLFLAFGKRRAEIELLNHSLKGRDIRATLEVYDKDKLNTALAVVNSICIITYLLFVTDPETISKHQSAKLIYTVPIVVYGLFRYMYKAQEGEGTGPVEIILKDKAFIGAILLWFGMIFLILYYHG